MGIGIVVLNAHLIHVWFQVKNSRFFQTSNFSEKTGPRLDLGVWYLFQIHLCSRFTDRFSAKKFRRFFEKKILPQNSGFLHLTRCKTKSAAKNFPILTYNVQFSEMNRLHTYSFIKKFIAPLIFILKAPAQPTMVTTIVDFIPNSHSQNSATCSQEC